MTEHRPSDFDYYQRAASQTAIYPGQGSVVGLVYCALKLNGEAGELAEHVGKAIRDDRLMVPADTGADVHTFNLTDERRVAIMAELGDVLWYLSQICRELGINFSDVPAGNLSKLSDRQQRGKLGGSGDTR